MFHKYVISLIFLLIVGVTFAQTSLTATTLSNLNIRSGPGVDYGVVTKINRGTQVAISGRNEASDWLFIHTADNSTQGWAAIGFIQFDHAVSVPREIPLMAPDTAVAATTNPVVTSSTASSEEMPVVTTHTNLPDIWIDAEVLQNVRAIYQHGQELGHNPYSFIKVGESNLAWGFMCNFQWGNYELGAFDYLQVVVDRFNETGSFCRMDAAAQPGFSTFTIMDPTFALPEFCTANETPLACDIRRSRPSYAIVYVGIADLSQGLSPDEFRLSLTWILQQLQAAGVVPIVATFTIMPQYAPEGLPEQFNVAIREIVESEKVPLIDLRSIVWGYTNHGVGSDGTHLSLPGDGVTSFWGNENHFGRTKYELLVMQVLYRMITEINAQ